MRKFYVASSLSNAEAARSLILELEEEYKWQCTYDWTVHGSAKKMPDVVSGKVKFGDIAREIAAKEITGVVTSHALIVLLPGGRGTHAEIGAAIASGVKVFIIYNEESDFNGSSDYPCVFYWHPRVARIKTSDLKYGIADTIVKMIKP